MATTELSVQYLEIYNDQVIDLLARPDKIDQDLKLYEQADGSVQVTGSVIRVVETIDDAYLALMYGQRQRAIASTKLNSRSTRSHTIFTIMHKRTNEDGSQVLGRLNLVDLAGSERIAKTEAKG